MAKKKAVKKTRTAPRTAPAPEAPIKTLNASDLMPSTGGDSEDELEKVEAEARRLESRQRVEAETKTDAEVARMFPRGSLRRQTQVRNSMVGAGEPGETASDALDAYPDLVKEIRAPLTPIDVSPGERVFHSKYERHVVQVSTPSPEYDPLHGKRIDKPGHVILFTPRPELGVGEFRTTDSKDILFLEGGEYVDPEGKKWDIPPAMGYGNLIWDAVAKRKAEARIYVRNFKEQLAASPEVVDVLRQELPAEEFSIFDMLAKQVRKQGLGEDFS